MSEKKITTIKQEIDIDSVIFVIHWNRVSGKWKITAYSPENAPSVSSETASILFNNITKVIDEKGIDFGDNSLEEKEEKKLMN